MRQSHKAAKLCGMHAGVCRYRRIWSNSARPVRVSGSVRITVAPGERGVDLGKLFAVVLADATAVLCNPTWLKVSAHGLVR